MPASLREDFVTLLHPVLFRDLSRKLRGGRVNSIEFLATNRRGCCDSPEVPEKSDDMGSLVALLGIEPGFKIENLHTCLVAKIIFSVCT